MMAHVLGTLTIPPLARSFSLTGNLSRAHLRPAIRTLPDALVPRPTCHRHWFFTRTSSDSEAPFRFFGFRRFLHEKRAQVTLAARGPDGRFRWRDEKGQIGATMGLFLVPPLPRCRYNNKGCSNLSARTVVGALAWERSAWDIRVPFNHHVSAAEGG